MYTISNEIFYHIRRRISGKNNPASKPVALRD
jgi:hypothetical protein